MTESARDLCWGYTFQLWSSLPCAIDAFFGVGRAGPRTLRAGDMALALGRGGCALSSARMIPAWGHFCLGGCLGVDIV